GPPTFAPPGAVDVKLMVWSPLAPSATAKDCCTCGAALYVASPAWLASMTHVPTPINDTVEPASEHTDVAAASSVKGTGDPDVAVAVTVYVGPPTIAAPGAGDVKLIVCGSWPLAGSVQPVKGVVTLKVRLPRHLPVAPGRNSMPLSAPVMRFSS